MHTTRRMEPERERLLPEPDTYVKCFYDLFKSIAEAQRCVCKRQ